jgi:hypothetical protein
MKDESDPTKDHQLQTRRTLLFGAVGAVAAWTAGLFGLASPVAAANGGSVLLGSANTATATTSITTTAGNGIAGTGPIGVSGTSTGTTATSAGVYGVSSSTANYGVYSAGKLGVVGPIEMAVLTITNYAGPATGKAFLYVKTNGSVTELHVKFPSGLDKVIASG